MGKTIIYIYRGLIEHGRRWVEGYSETTQSGTVIYPWLSKSACRKEARAKGAKAVFVREHASKETAT